MMGAAPPGRSRGGGGGGGYGGKGGRPMKMRSKRMGRAAVPAEDASSRTSARRRRNPAPPPRAPPRARGAREQQRGPDGNAGAPAPAANGRRARRRLGRDGAAAAPRRSLRQARRRRLPPPDYHQIHYSVARLEPEGPPLRREANDLRRGPPRHRERKARVARRFDALGAAPSPCLSTQLHVVVAATPPPDHARRGGDRDPRQREPNPQGGTVVSPRGVDAVRRGAPDPGHLAACRRSPGARGGAARRQPPPSACPAQPGQTCSSPPSTRTPTLSCVGADARRRARERGPSRPRL